MCILPLRDIFLIVLTQEQSLRPRPNWHACEMQAMLNAVNRECAVRKYEQFSMANLERVESMARGHSDYASKFALYCAELVIYPNGVTAGIARQRRAVV